MSCKNEQVVKLLDYFKELPNEKWDQKFGYIHANTMSGNQEDCNVGACFGAHIHFCMAGELNPVELRNYDEGGGYDLVGWSWKYGWKILIDILGSRYEQVDETLHKHGASTSPFFPADWEKDPYTVLKETVKEICGIEHENIEEGHHAV